ncbi:MAG: leucine-rich repeat domain-containing protein [Romboutsia timonensis]
MNDKIDIELTNSELKTISDIIKKYNLKDNLRNNNIEGLYSEKLTALEHSMITQLLYSIDIDPLDYLDSIPTGFLTYCDKITKIDIPNHIEYIEKQAFLYCKELIKLSIPDSVKHIGDYAFSSCLNLSTINIGNNTESIGAYAFYGTKLSSIIIPDNVVNIRDHAFYNSPLEYLKLGKGIKNIGEDAFMYTNLKSIDYAGTIEDYNKIKLNGRVFDKMMEKVVCTDGVIELNYE